MNLDEFKYTGTNITSIRLVNPKSKEVMNVINDWMYGEYVEGIVLDKEIAQITVISLFIY